MNIGKEAHEDRWGLLMNGSLNCLHPECYQSTLEKIADPVLGLSQVGS